MIGFSKKGKTPRIASKRAGGFTLVELLVSIAIFTIMTTLVVVKYGSFNQSVLFTNLAYDIAAVIRTAQVYGVSVRMTDSVLTGYETAYTVMFSSQANTPDSSGATRDRFVLFSDIDADGIYDDGHDAVVSTNSLKRGAIIQGFCESSSCQDLSSETRVSITFKRPDPDAIICLYGSQTRCGIGYLKILIRNPDGGQRAVVVRSNGQIAVQE